MILSFDACDRRECVNVTIVDDVQLERIEQLTYHLAETVNLDRRITLNPVDGMIEIIDNDSKYIHEMIQHRMQFYILILLSDYHFVYLQEL